MNKTKKLLLTALSVALVAIIAVFGTVAYLMDTDSDVNVMTLGNVQIEQHEYQRVQNADGTYKTDSIDNRTSYVLEDFEQAKPLYPAIIPNGGTVNGVTWDYDSIPVRMSQVKSHGGASVFNTPNAQDKFVTVENTGKSDAYVRTLVAFEVGTATIVDDSNQPLISSEIRATTEEENTAEATMGKQPWTYGFREYVEIDGNKYLVYELIYTGAKTSSGWKHENGVLPAGETTYPSLCQVYMASRATNEDVEALDGNNNGTYDILVLSQAVQVDGFADAETALDTGFGDVTAENVVKWFGEEDIEIPVVVDDEGQLKNALAVGGNVVLGGEIDNENVKNYSNGNTAEIYLNSENGAITLSGGKLIIDENATYGLYPYAKYNPITIKDMEIESNAKFGLIAWPSTANDVVTIENVDVNAAGGVGIYAYGPGKTVINNCSVGQSGLSYAETPWAETAIAASSGAVFEINGGKYEGNTTALWIYNSGATVVINDGTFVGAIKVDAGSVTINGGTFSVDPSTVSGVTVNGTLVNNNDGTWTVTPAN